MMVHSIVQRICGYRHPVYLSLVVLGLLQVSGVNAAPLETALTGVVRDARVLEAEIKIARNPKPYFVVDARDSTVRIKAAGVALKTIPIRRMIAWGDAVPPTPLRLNQKSTLIEPKRPIINPNAAKKQTAGEDRLASDAAADVLDALEVKDMPTRFRLELDQGIHVTVRPAPDGIVAWGREWAYSAAWYLSRPLATVWSRARGKPYAALYLRVAPQDARALYWACANGSEVLVVSS